MTTRLVILFAVAFVGIGLGLIGRWLIGRRVRSAFGADPADALSPELWIITAPYCASCSHLRRRLDSWQPKWSTKWSTSPNIRNWSELLASAAPPRSWPSASHVSPAACTETSLTRSSPRRSISHGHDVSCHPPDRRFSGVVPHRRTTERRRRGRPRAISNRRLRGAVAVPLVGPRCLPQPRQFDGKGRSRRPICRDRMRDAYRP